jgi:hypothetical protein
MEIAATVQRVIQVTIAARISAILVSTVPSPYQRIALAVGAAVLLAGGRARMRSPLPSAAVLSDLAVAVASSVLLQAIAAGGADSLPIRVATLCAVLEAGQSLAPFLGDLAGGFLYNAQFLFAGVFADAILAPRASLVALAFALTAAAGTGLADGANSLLTGGLVNASLIVARALLEANVPVGLQLPSLIALVSFLRPLHVTLGSDDSVYYFLLYQVSDAVKAAAQSALTPFQGAIACVTALAIAPTPALVAVAQLASVGGVTDAILWALQQALAVDPFLCLAPVLILTRVLAGLTRDAPA